MKTKHHGQMSESFLTAVFLSLSGGLQDAYTYLFRGKVFANAQTGNIVLLSANIMDGQWDKVLHYLVPLCAFALFWSGKHSRYVKMISETVPKCIIIEPEKRVQV